jgi:hypothetical protein
MQARNLLECTIDLTQPLPELTAVISAVLSALPDVDKRLAVLHALGDEITTALLTLEDGIGEEESYDKRRNTH